MKTTHNISTTAKTSSTIAPTVGVFHYVDLDTNTDQISVDGVVHTPSAVLGSGSDLWVWHGGVRYHAADWGGDNEEVTPLMREESATRKTEIRHNGGMSNVWSTDGGVSWCWANAAGEGSWEPTFEAAMASAESALTWKADATAKLRELAALVPAEMAAHVAVCEFSSDDATPALHIDLWRGFDLVDLPQAVAELAVAVEGNWDGGRSYSLHIA